MIVKCYNTKSGRWEEIGIFFLLRNLQTKLQRRYHMESERKNMYTKRKAWRKSLHQLLGVAHLINYRIHHKEMRGWVLRGFGMTEHREPVLSQPFATNEQIRLCTACYYWYWFSASADRRHKVHQPRHSGTQPTQTVFQ